MNLWVLCDYGQLKVECFHSVYHCGFYMSVMLDNILSEKNCTSLLVGNSQCQ